MNEKNKGFSVGKKTIFWVFFFHGLFLLFLGIESSLSPKPHSFMVRSVQMGKTKTSITPKFSSPIMEKKEEIAKASLDLNASSLKLRQQEEKQQEKAETKIAVVAVVKEKESSKKPEKKEEAKDKTKENKVEKKAEKIEVNKNKKPPDSSVKKLKVDEGKKKSKTVEKKDFKKKEATKKTTENSVKSKAKEAAKQKAKENQELSKMMNSLQRSLSKLEEANLESFKGQKKINVNGNVGKSGNKDRGEIKGLNKMPSLIQNLEIDAEIEGDVGDFFDNGYQARLISELKNELKLPDVGEVKAKISIGCEGKISDVEIIYSRSKKNERYLKNTLPCLNFPWFNAFVSASEKKQFSIVFRNEDF
jgi:outer membrane biosynthesis protein TonB